MSYHYIFKSRKNNPSASTAAPPIQSAWITTSIFFFRRPENSPP